MFRPVSAAVGFLGGALLLVALPSCGHSGAAPDLGADLHAPLDAGGEDLSAAVDLATVHDLASCDGLACDIHHCEGDAAAYGTTITGSIFDPAGNHPVYGAVAYVPSGPLSSLSTLASCHTCADLYSGNSIASSVTDAQGRFVIANAPDGTDIPVVIQVGKWRRQFVVPTVASCGEAEMGMLTLPKNGTEGDMPQIAVSTGGADSIECLFGRMGVDASEYVPGAGTGGHIHIFQGTNGKTTSPAAPTSSTTLWSSDSQIAAYDMVVLSCEGAETSDMNQQVLFDYAKNGGRVLANHFHYSWFNSGPFAAYDIATWTTGANDIGNDSATIVTQLGASPFPRGQAFHDWLAGPSVAALTSDALPIPRAMHNADVSSTELAQPWAVNAATSVVPGAAEILTFDTPLGSAPAQQCGRVAYTDMHIGTSADDYQSSSTVPSGCGTATMAPTEEALEYFVFDVGSCVTPSNGVMPAP